MNFSRIFQKKNYPLILGLFVAIFFVGTTIVFLATRTEYDNQGVVATNFQSSQKVSVVHENVEQFFTAKNKNLNKIALAFGRHQRVINPSLSLLSWPDNTLLYKKTLVLPPSDEIKYSYWEFPVFADSENKTYILKIENSGSESIDLLLVDKDRYPEGRLLINDGEYNENLTFYFSYYKKNQVGLLLNRLSAYKPWIFGQPISFVILFFFYFTILAGLAYSLAKNNDDKDNTN